MEWIIYCKKDGNRRQDKGRCVCLGGTICSFSCRHSCFDSVDLEETVEFNRFFQIDRGKTAGAVRKNTFCPFPPQTDATTFVFASLSILLLWSGCNSLVKRQVSNLKVRFIFWNWRIVERSGKMQKRFQFSSLLGFFINKDLKGRRHHKLMSFYHLSCCFMDELFLHFCDVHYVLRQNFFPRQNVPRTKRPKVQNVPRDNMCGQLPNPIRSI